MLLELIDKESEDALCVILAQEQEAFEDFLLQEEIEAYLSDLIDLEELYVEY
jgi:hypothetical protein